MSGADRGLLASLRDWSRRSGDLLDTDCVLLGPRLHLIE
jgi:hypothetical protein